MGKHKAKMKLSSRKNGTLIPDDDSDSDLQEFSLPKKRIIKPGKSTYVARRRCDCCRACVSLFLSVLLIASVLCVVVLGWFSLRLKRDLDFMKKRLSEVESTDRSTSTEYDTMNKDLTKKYEFLRVSREDTMKQEGEHYKSILRQIAFLNSTVNDLQNRVKLPEGAHAISTDIESLKKGMADTGGDITEIKDKIKQLTDLASHQQNKVHEVSRQIYNLTIQVARMSGKPPPKVPVVTGTPPLILRMPPSADENGPAKDKSSLNVSALISVKVAMIMGTVTTVNNTLSSEVDKLQYLMKNLLKEVKKHMATVDELKNEVSNFLKPDHSSVVSRGHLEMDRGRDFQEHIQNLSMIVSKLTLDMDQHSKKLAGLMWEIVQVNNSVHQAEPAVVEKPVTCNCSGDVNKLWEALSINKQTMESLKRELQALKEERESNGNDTGVEIILEKPSNEVQPRVNSTTINEQNVTTETELELKVQDIGASSTNNSVNSTLLPGVISEPSPNHPVNSSDEGTVNTRVHGAQPTNNTTYRPTISIRSTKSTVASGVANDRATGTSLSAEEKFENNLERPGSE